MYVSLHNRSAYSFGTALTTPVQLAAFACEQRMPAIALTDLHGLYAAVEFQQECRAAGVKPIFGAEMVLTDGLTVTLLAQTPKGYGHLCRLISRHHLQGASTADVCEYTEDVICIIGGWPTSSEVGSRFLAPKTGWATETLPSARWTGSTMRTTGATENGRYGARPLHMLREAFAGGLYIELAIHRPEDVPIARRRAVWADAMNIPVVATCESRCVKREEMRMLRALASIGTLTLLDRPHPDKPEGVWHLRTSAEMQHLFRRRPDALANTLRIAEQCNVLLDLDRNRFPKFTSPDGRSAMEHLRELCVAGCRRRYVEQPPPKGMGGRRPTLDEALARLERELVIIDQVHYAEYFLVFHEIVEYCRSRGIATLARGSAADSLVCYALGVSHACPFRFDLPFDRFLNAERARFSKMADIDLDLPWDRRDEVIRWVYDRWGHDSVAMIGSPNTFHARAAIAELGKVFGLPAHEVHQVTRRLPYTAVHNLPRYLARSPEARELPMDDEPYRTILRMAFALEGLPRHWAMHPCGLVVSPEPLTDLVPVQPSPKGPLVAQYDMDAIETLGFIKIDLLGQAGLSVLRDAVAEIERTEARGVGILPASSSRAVSTSIVPRAPLQERPVQSPAATEGENASVECGTRGTPFIDLERDVDYSDAATWDLITTGNARGVHHIESPAMTSLLQQCNCRDIDCLTAIVAIIRPGAANQGKKEVFARRHAGREAPTYAHPSVRPVLEKTYGLMVFEEHILQIATEFAGLNLGEADVLRRALNKENRAMITEMGKKFVDNALRLGRTPAEIKAVWELVSGFSGFMFNKAHSAEYAVEAFQGAWLKLRWPAHYLAAILSNYRGFYAHSPTLPQILYVMEALRLGIRFLPPCANRSRPKFSVEGGWPTFSEGGFTISAAEAPHPAVASADPVTNKSRIQVQRTWATRPGGQGDKETRGQGDKGIRGQGEEQGGAQGGIQNLKCAIRGWPTFSEGGFTISADEGPHPPVTPAVPVTNKSRTQVQRTWATRPGGQGDKGTRGQGEEQSDAQGGIRNPEWAIRIPVTHIHGLSEAFLERYLVERERGPFTSLENFLDRCRPGEAEALALLDAGALDCLGPSRPELFWQLRRLFRQATPGGPVLWKGRDYGRDPTPPIDLTLPDARQRARRETELLGFPVTMHPLDYLGGDDKGRRIDWSRYTPVSQLAHYPGRRVHVCGLMVADRITGTLGKTDTLGKGTMSTSSEPLPPPAGVPRPFEWSQPPASSDGNDAPAGGLMKFVTLADRTGFVEAILFPDVYRHFGHLTAAHPILAATGIVEPFETGTGFTLRVQNVRPPVMIEVGK